MPEPDALAHQLRDSPLDDLLVICMRQYPAPDGIFQNVLAAVQVRSAMESAKAAAAATETAKWTRFLAFGTFALAAGTVVLAIVTAVIR
jgi:cell division protein FtsX